MPEPITLSTSFAGIEENTVVASADSARQAWLNFIQIPEHFTIEKSADNSKPLLMNHTGESLAEYFHKYKSGEDKSIVRHINTAWTNSKNTLEEVESFSKPLVKPAFDSYSDIAVLVFLVAFFLIAIDRIIQGITMAFRSIFNERKQEETDDDMNSKSGRNTAMCFLILLSSFVFSHQLAESEVFSNIPSIVAFLATAGCAFSYLLIKKLIFKILDYTNYSGSFKIINYLGYTYMIVGLSILLSGDIIYFLVSDIPQWIINTWLAISCGLPALIYLILGNGILRKNRFSPFFYILYLCVLEILPIILIVKVL